jgi:acyl phosphate:glycerol-3-phosphate acyltransferase
MDALQTTESVLAIAIAYCLGSISTAYLVGRSVKGVDMTEVGNGRIGATFTARRLGIAWGAVVGVGDSLKGIAAVVMPLALHLPAVVSCLCALGAMAGHNWSVFLRFKGGRGAATSFGSLLALTWWAILIPTIPVLLILYSRRQTEFVLGLRRTTVLFALLMFCISCLVWLQLSVGFPPPVPWSPTSPILIALPPAMLILNIMGGFRTPKGNTGPGQGPRPEDGDDRPFTISP